MVDLPEPYKAAAVLSYERALRGAFYFCFAMALVTVLSGLGMREIDATKGEPIRDDDSADDQSER